jgi:hypothetical protein
VVHAAGPFQGQDYSVAELCIRHRVHYVDLADDSAFVRDINRLNEPDRWSPMTENVAVNESPASDQLPGSFRSHRSASRTRYFSSVSSIAV